jgi:tritrans,polycis-undecaprenyl-diphosphate synthase [geranylgeranyl-diphosphate specific]
MTDDVIKNDKIHIALIPDGNRRYAKKLGKPIWYGHKVGAKKIEEFIRWCSDYEQIKTVTIFALSTENLKRDEKELNNLWDIYRIHLRRIMRLKSVKEGKIKINVLGLKNTWRSDVRQAAEDVMKLTAQYSRMVANIMISYGSKFEIIDAVKKLIKKGIKKGPIKKIFDNYLLVSQPVDLIIRTGNQHRLSNFLLYQSAYAEIYFSKTLWPEFTREEFDKIMRWYFKQQRKFGR